MKYFLLLPCLLIFSACVKEVKKADNSRYETLQDVLKNNGREQSLEGVESTGLTNFQFDNLIRDLDKQISSCLRAGIKQPLHNISIVIIIAVNSDRTIKNVRIQDQLRYSNDSFYRAITDEVLKAVKHQDCKVLNISKEYSNYYDVWKEIEFNVNPAEML